MYKEICEYTKECSVIDYLVWGGFPKRFEFNTDQAVIRYINDLDETIVVNDEKAYNKEFSAFNNIDNLSQKIIITNDDIDYSTSVEKHIKFKDFLLKESLEV